MTDLPGTAPMTGKYVQLRPVFEEDVPMLFRSAVSRPWHWPRLGTTQVIPPNRFSEYLWSGVQVQFLACDSVGEPGLLLRITRPDNTSQTAWLELVELYPGGPPGPEVVEAIQLTVAYVFSTWRFRKIYSEYVEYTFNPLSCFAFAIEEARLRNDTFHDGVYWDRVTATLYRKDWEPLARSRGAERAL